MLNARNMLATFLLIISLLSSGAAGAQSLNITIPGEDPEVPTAGDDAESALPGGLVLTDRLAEQIRTLIRIALLTGDASAFENALFDLTVKVPDLAASIAAFTTSEIYGQVSAISAETTVIITMDFIQSMTIAATVAPATAAPARFQEIVTATAKVIATAAPALFASPATAEAAALDQTALMEKIKAQVETSLIELFNDPTITADNLADIFTAAGSAADLAETPTTEAASPTG